MCIQALGKDEAGDFVRTRLDCEQPVGHSGGSQAAYIAKLGQAVELLN